MEKVSSNLLPKHVFFIFKGVSLFKLYSMETKVKQ